MAVYELPGPFADSAICSPVNSNELVSFRTGGELEGRGSRQPPGEPCLVGMNEDRVSPGVNSPPKTTGAAQLSSPPADMSHCSTIDMLPPAAEGEL